MKKPTTTKPAAKASPKPRTSPNTADKPEVDEPVIHAAFEQGRTARRARISRDDAPHGDGASLDAWRKGWDFEEQNVG